MSGLPDNWTYATLESLGRWGSGGTPPRTNPEYFEGGKIPWLIIGDLNDHVVTHAATHITEAGLANSSAKLLPPETLLVAMYGSIGKLGITGIECATNQAIAFCKPNAEITSLRYLFYAVMNAKDGLVSLGQGGAQQNISQGILKAYEIPLAPLSEQSRIANKLDAVLARVDTCRDRLDRIPAILKRFRQSVLAAATSGELTEDWREGSRESDWTPSRLSACGTVSGGLTKNAKRQSLDLVKQYLRVANVYANRLELSDVAEIGLTESEYAKTRLQSGDLLIVEGNGSLDQLGRVALWSDELDDCVHQNHLIRWRTSGPLPQFVLYWLLSPRGRTDLMNLASTTTGLHTLSISKVGAVPIDLPSMPEQAEIVRRVETLFAFADRLEARYIAAHTQIEKLTPSLLAKAFRGKLVPQDPNDEPASVLLERIRTMRIKASEESKPRIRREKTLIDEVSMHSLDKNASDYLTAILRRSKGRTLDAKALWQETQLSIPDFYEKLKAEADSGLLREIKTDDRCFLEAV